MTGWLPEVEGWVKVVGAAVAVLMALLVPIRSWISEDRRYKAQTAEAAASAAKSVIAGVSAPSPGGGSMLGDVLASSALTDAVRDVAKAIREGTAAEREATESRLAKAIEGLLKQEEERSRP